MHSRMVSIAAIAAINVLLLFWKHDANAVDWIDGQEILVECPVWEWEPSPILNVEYELCFDDVDQCTVAEIGDTVCIPSLGAHDVWVTAIEYQDGEPIYHDGDIVPIFLHKPADFNGDGAVGFPDVATFIRFFGAQNMDVLDLDGNGAVGFPDFDQLTRAFGKCVNEGATLYEPC